MRSRRAAALAASLGLMGGGAAWTIGPALADSPATVDDTTAPSGDDTAAANDDATTDTVSTEDEATDEAATDETTTADASTDAAAPDETATQRRSWITDTLASLVDDGTLTQEQADAVATALQDARPAREAGRIGNRIAVSLDTLTETLGVTAEDLSAAFAEGQSIADVAEAQSVDVQTVVDALVAAASEHIDAAVADGTLTEAEAAERLTTATERISELVNQAGGPSLPGRPGRPSGPGGFPGSGPGGSGFPGGGPSAPGGGQEGHGAPDAPAAPDAESGSTGTAPTAGDTATTDATTAGSTADA